MFFFLNPVCSSISVCCKTPVEFLALSPSSWTSPSLSMKRYPGWHVGQPLWLAEWSGWLQTSQICSTLLPVAFSFFLCACVWETVSGHVAMPTASHAAGYASLASSANGKTGLRCSYTPAQQLFGWTCVQSECTSRPSSSSSIFFF